MRHTLMLLRAASARISRRRAIARGLTALTAVALAHRASLEAAIAAESLGARLDDAIDEAIAGRRIVGAVVIAMRAREVVYRRAAGYRDREAGEPMCTDAIFRLGSLSKTVVSAAAMALVERGRMNLDDPVTRWLPDFRPGTPDGTVPVVSVRHLLTHTAGLSYGFLQPQDGPYRRAGVSDGFDRSGIALDEEVRRIAAAGLSYAPGTRWGYSIASDVLGAVIERAAGEPLPDAVRRLVTAPLDMADTGFLAGDAGRLTIPYADGSPEPARMADPQLVGFRGPGVIRFAPARALDRTEFPSGGAGMVGTADDFARLLEALRAGGGPILRPASAQQMTASQTGDLAITNAPGWGFGYGTLVLANPATARTPYAAGTWAFTSAYGHSFLVDPQRQLTVVAFTNTALEGGFGRFVAAIRGAVAGPEPA
jgi:CubicO group peptidase (beta-lactamase class C family)